MLLKINYATIFKIRLWTFFSSAFRYYHENAERQHTVRVQTGCELPGWPVILKTSDP